jgi:hypothetical protein
MSRASIEAAIEAISTHQNPDLASGLAEGLVIAYFTSSVITADDFKAYCAQIRDISLERSARRAA